MNYYKYFLTTYFTLILISIYGQETTVDRLNSLLNQGRYFESKELYDKIHNTLDFDEELYYKYRMYSFMDKKDSIAYCLEKMLEYYPEFIGNQTIYAYAELFELYFDLNNNEKGISTYKRIIEHLEDNPYDIKKTEIELWRNSIEKRLIYFKKAMSVPSIKIKRKVIDDYPNLAVENKLSFDAYFNSTKQKTVFDTGLQYHCVINRYYAEKMNIKYDTSKMVKESFNNTEILVHEVTIDSIEIGNIIIYNLPIRILDNDISQNLTDSINNDSINTKKITSVKNEIDSPIIGLPVMQLIGKFLIDYENSKLSFPVLHDTLKTTKKPNIFFYDNNVYIQTKLNNTNFTGLLNTGYNGYIDIDSIFYEKYKNDISIDTTKTKVPFYLTMFHHTWFDIPYQFSKEANIIFNNKHITTSAKKDDTIRIYSMQPVWPIKIIDGVIGYDFFKRIGKKVLLDLDNMRLEAIE